MAKGLTGNSRRTDLHRVPPTELVARPQNRGRFAPPDQEAVKALALSMLQQGQLQHINVRRDGTELVIVAGFTRHEAAMMIVEGFTVEGQEFQDPEFLIDVRLLNTNEEDAFFNNVTENALRNETSPMDDAHNQEVMRQRYGKSDAEIAAIFHCSITSVISNKKLLNLSKDFQRMVHDGTLPVTAAVLFVDIPEAEREAFLQEVRDEHGKVRTAKVKARLRESQPKNTPPRSQKLSRSTKELRDIFTQRAQADAPAPVKDLMASIVDLISGTLTTEEFDIRLQELTESYKQLA